MKRNFGWIRDEKDSRDLKFILPGVIELPNEISLFHLNPNVYNQLTWGSCVYNAGGSLFHGRLILQGQDFIPSRFFPYYIARKGYGKINDDCGSQIRDCVKIYVKYGVCPESMWLYEAKNFATEPPESCYEEALNHQALEYRSINQTLVDLKTCLAMGNTFICGIDIYQSFMTSGVSKTGIVPMPKPKFEKLLGGHAIEVVGYYEKLRCFLCKNSWGKNWGMHGYFLIPYEYLLDKQFADDFWTITLVETD
jgi:hypothetical protein